MTYFVNLRPKVNIDIVIGVIPMNVTMLYGTTFIGVKAIKILTR